MDFPAWDPVLIDIPGLPIDIRWYGLMYVVGFVVGQWILTRLARRGFCPVPAERIPDLVLYLVLGVIIGGRLGYALIYDQHLLHPLRFFQLWKGGLAFHGGLVGVMAAFLLFTRKHRVPVLRMFDCGALAVTPGIFAVRMANFINGELYGRVTGKGVGLAMQFPTDPEAVRLLHLSDAWSMRDRELCIQVAFGRRTWESVQPMLSQVDEHGHAIRWDNVKGFLNWGAVRDQVPYRHPSQLYEGFGEGLLLGLVLLVLYLALNKRTPKPGFFGGVFLIGYGAVRFCIEFLRQPDRQFSSDKDPVGTVLLGMTMGQVLCVGMVLCGVLLIVLPRRQPQAAGAAA
jgi:phosphatidylglycerol---prolipoprotein diacylglyceryl transferase